MNCRTAKILSGALYLLRDHVHVWPADARKAGAPADVQGEREKHHRLHIGSK